MRKTRGCIRAAPLHPVRCMPEEEQPPVPLGYALFWILATVFWIRTGIPDSENR